MKFLWRLDIPGHEGNEKRSTEMSSSLLADCLVCLVESGMSTRHRSFNHYSRVSLLQLCQHCLYCRQAQCLDCGHSWLTVFRHQRPMLRLHWYSILWDIYCACILPIMVTFLLKFNEYQLLKWLQSLYLGGWRKRFGPDDAMQEKVWNRSGVPIGCWRKPPWVPFGILSTRSLPRWWPIWLKFERGTFRLPILSPVLENQKGLEWSHSISHTLVPVSSPNGPHQASGWRGAIFQWCIWFWNWN